jgi:hypothetical protein
VLSDQVLKQMRHFICPGCDISVDYDRELDNKIAKYKKFFGIVRRTLGKEESKETQQTFWVKRGVRKHNKHFG